MMRTPCCEKMGLKKGPWTPDEDEKLLAYIQHHAHGRRRSLPKQAKGDKDITYEHKRQNNNYNKYIQKKITVSRPQLTTIFDRYIKYSASRVCEYFVHLSYYIEFLL